MTATAYLVLTDRFGNPVTSVENKNHTTPFNSDQLSPLPHRDTPKSATSLFALQDFSLGASNPATFTSTGARAGKEQFDVLEVKRYVDVETPALFFLQCGGQQLKYVDLYVCQNQESGLLLRTAFGTGSVLATSLDWSYDEAEGLLSETVKFTFGQLWTAYRTQSDTGALGGWAVRGWDRVANRVPS